MNKNVYIKGKLKIFALSIVFIGLFILFFAFDPLSQNAYADYINSTQSEEEYLSSNEANEMYTVNFFNGDEGIGTFNISPGDQYTLTQNGYTINGNTFEFTGKLKMNNCAYGDYYGLPTIDNVTVATYSGWSLNGTMISNSGIWMEYETSILNVYAVWTPVNFAVELNDEYTGNSSQEVNYFDGITLPCLVREGYEFKGWQTSNDLLYQGGTTLHPIEGIELTSKWEEIFEVRLISSTHSSYDRTWEGTMGYTFTLPSLTSGNYYVSQWGTYQVGEEYAIIGDATLYAVWKGNNYTITYANLTFMGVTAELEWDSEAYLNGPRCYEYGVGIDLLGISARWPTSSPYDSQLVFLGWYTNMNFTTKVNNINTSATGNKTYYAKWRYDFNKKGRYGSYYITDEDPYTEDYQDSIALELNYNNLYQELKNIGINYVYLEFKLKIREVDDGYQEVYIYKSTSPTSNPIWSVDDIDHYPPGKGTTAEYYIWECAFSIDDLRDCSYLYVRYGANGAWGDNWVTDELHVDIMYTVTTSSDEGVEEFTWDYRAEVPDSNCIPLENVSDSY